MFCRAIIGRSVFCVMLAFFVSDALIVAQTDGISDHKQNESSCSSKQDEVFPIRNFDALSLNQYAEKIKFLGKGEAERSSLDKDSGDGQDEVSDNRRTFFGKTFSVKRHINDILGQCGREYNHLDDDMSPVVLCVFNKVPSSMVMFKKAFGKGVYQLNKYVETKLDQYDKEFEDLNKNYPDSFNRVPDMMQNIKKGVGDSFENLKNSFQKGGYIAEPKLQGNETQTDLPFQVAKSNEKDTKQNESSDTTAASDHDVKEQLQLETMFVALDSMDNKRIDDMGSTMGSSIHVDSAYNSTENSSHGRVLLSENSDRVDRFFYFGWPSFVLRGGRFYVALKKMALVCAGVGICGRLFSKLYEKYGSSLKDYFDFYYHDLFNRHASLHQENDTLLLEEELDA